MTQLRYRLEIYTANVQRAGAEFFPTKAAAMERRRELREAGFTATCFTVGDGGGLLPGLHAPHVLNARTTTTGQGTLL